MTFTATQDGFALTSYACEAGECVKIATPDRRLLMMTEANAIALAEVLRLWRADREQVIEIGLALDQQHLREREADTELQEANGEYPPQCTYPGGHVWSGNDYGRCLCIYCGADGDA